MLSFLPTLGHRVHPVSWLTLSGIFSRRAAERDMWWNNECLGVSEVPHTHGWPRARLPGCPFSSASSRAVTASDILCIIIYCYVWLHPTPHHTSLYYTTLHSTPLHYTALHCTALHYFTLNAVMSCALAVSLHHSVQEIKRQFLQWVLERCPFRMREQRSSVDYTAVSQT